ncbi:PREDICTED: X-ray repair cross-complementing protein 5-like [Dufourea novaeangliae]|uniref:X-ray repair cross-complementing protein 5-like n=1 Tax=Dufourea novaeangliae TaxID=178035 RepID=UPI00076703C1|nr:PREDICTED: X-ray repair cross-complementing protein 5-like [Dufourea novaeangliae]
MPPKPAKETLIFLMNIGVTSSDKQSNPSLIEKAKHIMKRIVERKIFLQPKHEIGVILMGSSITKNSLDTEHVEEFLDIQIPNWNMIEKIMLLQATNYCSNWVEALIATVNYMKKKVIDACLRKVILMSDFNEEEDIISQFQIDEIADIISTSEIGLLSIGEKSLDETSLNISKQFLKALLTKIKGQHIIFDNAISDYRFYEQVPTNPMPWNATLELIDIKIPIANYLKVTDDKKFPSWKLAKEKKSLKSVVRYLDRQRTNYKRDEIVAGYKYGGEFVSINDESLRYKSGPQNYSICSFTSRDNIDLEYWYDKTTRVVLPSPRVEYAARPFYNLVQAMHNRNLVAIVRKVYRENSAPQMVALFPCIDVPDEPWCLVEIALAFAEDRRVIETRPMKSVIKQLTNEQNEAVDNLLDSLMLPDTEDSYEADGRHCFLPGCEPDPALQHKWHMLSYRALHPNEPLPLMDNYLKEVLEDSSLKENSKYHLQKIAKLFKLESIEPKKTRRDASKEEDNIQNVDMTNVEESVKMDDKFDAMDSFDESVMSLDTSDIDVADLADNI